MGALPLLGAGTAGGPGVPPFSPSDLSLVAWYDASDTATVTDAGGGAASAWNDKSTNVRHLSQATAGKRPLTGTRTINALNVLDFDGVDDALASANITQAQPVTVFAVVRADSTAVRQQYFGDNNEGITLGFNIATWLSEGVGGAFTSWDGAAPDTSAHVLECVFNAGSSLAAVDGVARTIAAPGTLGWSAKPIRLGLTSLSTDPFDGVLGEVVIAASALNTTDRQSCRSYLGSKWGIAVS